VVEPEPVSVLLPLLVPELLVFLFFFAFFFVFEWEVLLLEVESSLMVPELEVERSDAPERFVPDWRELPDWLDEPDWL
jgi:hypothetical protein